MRLFHYTMADDRHLGAILRDGAIEPTAVLIEKGERPAVWFSAEPWWEPTATKMIGRPDGSVCDGSERELAESPGLARIEVLPEVAPCTWKSFKAIGGASSATVRALERTAIRHGARPWLWRVSFEAVLRSHWICLEIRRGAGLWIEVNGW